MSNLQKNHVKIDVFNEPKYHFDPNQVQSTSFRPHKTPNKQKNSAFVKIFFGRNASAASSITFRYITFTSYFYCYSAYAGTLTKVSAPTTVVR